jgi:hypothetical protein
MLMHAIKIDDNSQSYTIVSETKSLIADNLLQSIELDSKICIQLFECWMTNDELKSKIPKNKPMFRCSMFENRNGNMLKLFSIYYHINDVDNVPYFSYDYYQSSYHSTLGTFKSISPQSEILANLIQFAKKEMFLE